MTSKTEKFIEKATAVHEGYYSYENSVYEKNNIKLNITCPVHGEFWQRPNAHLNGRGCVKCRHKNPAKKDPRDEMVFDLTTREGMLEYIKTWEFEENKRSLGAKKHKDFIKRLEEETSFIDEHTNKKISNTIRLLVFLKGYTSMPTCVGDGCSGLVDVSPEKGLTDYCSHACSKTSSETRRKISEANGSDGVVESRRKASIEYYQTLAKERGYEDPMSYTHSSHFPDVIEKRKETWKNKR